MIWLMMIGEMRGMVHVERGGVVSWSGLVEGPRGCHWELMKVT